MSKAKFYVGFIILLNLEMKPFLPNITYVNLRKESEGGVGIDRIKYCMLHIA